MADSTCLINGFSYASTISNESKQGNPMHVLGESISFGRYMNESLSWERWSTFSPHKKYVEEAQRYAQPGSVAQKKVFFEAHYKKIAAQKAAAAAAALVQRGSCAAKTDEQLSNGAFPRQVVALGSCLGADVESEAAKNDEKIASSEEGIGAIVGEDNNNNNNKPSQVRNDSIDISRNSISVSENSGTTTSQIERPLLKKTSAAREDDEEDDATSAPSKKRTSFSSLRSSIQRKAWRVSPPTPVSNDVSEGNTDHPIHVEKIDYADGNGAIVGDYNNKLLEKSHVMNESTIGSKAKNHNKVMDSISVSESSGTTSITERPLLKKSAAREDDEEEDDATSAPRKTRPSFSSLRSSIRRRTWREAPPSTPVNLATAQTKRESNGIAQQALKLGAADFVTGENGLPPKSLGSLINLLPAEEPEKEPIRSSAKDSQSLGILSSSYRVTNKDRPTPLRTPIAGAKVSSEHGAATPETVNKRLQTPTIPSAQGGKTGPKRHIFSAIYSKSLSVCRNKLQSPTISSPFMLRTEERAARRKQKLEGKFNASEVERVQQQKTLKDKAGAEIRKLGCGLCFKARPLPDFYKEREPPKKIDAKPPQPMGPTKGSANKRKGTASMPRPPPPPPPPSASAKNSVAAAHENESPNIQL